MATRLYLGSTTWGGLSTAVNAGWNGTMSIFDRYKMTTTASTSFLTLTDSTSFTNQYWCIAQYWSAPMSSTFTAAQLDVSTWTVVMRHSEGNLTNNGFYLYRISIFDETGTTQRATGSYTGATEFATTLTSRRINAADFFGLTATSANDRICFEVGWFRDATASGTNNFSTEVGGNSGTDLVNDEIGTSQFNPWLETSLTLTFNTETRPSMKNPLMLVGAGS